MHLIMRIRDDWRFSDFEWYAFCNIAKDEIPNLAGLNRLEFPFDLRAHFKP